MNKLINRLIGCQLGSEFVKEYRRRNLTVHTSCGITMKIGFVSVNLKENIISISSIFLEQELSLVSKAQIHIQIKTKQNRPKLVDKQLSLLNTHPQGS